MLTRTSKAIRFAEANGLKGHATGDDDVFFSTGTFYVNN